MRSSSFPLRSVAVAAACLTGAASGFSVPDGLHLAQTAVAPLHLGELYAGYERVLADHPLPTQVATGATLAVVGDAIAQSTNKGYDARRAASFAVFDVAYRVLQHAIFPWIVVNLRGQYLGAVPFLGDNVDQFILSTTEMTLFNQLLVIPLVYYPTFFLIQGFVQGLTVEESIERGLGLFLPILKRNLQFWIPVQFTQFGFVPEELWIPSSCVAGLVWTVILSLFAGSATKTAPLPEPVMDMSDKTNLEELMARQAANGAAASAQAEAAAASVSSRETSKARV